MSQNSSTGSAAQELTERIRTRLIENDWAPDPHHVLQAIAHEGVVLGDTALLKLVAELQAEFTGTGPLNPLLSDDSVTDILVNGARAVFVDRGEGLLPVPIGFPHENAVRRLAQRLASQAGRRLDEASPYVDARLPSGIRFHAVIPPIATLGTCISLRIPRKGGMSLAQLVAAGAISAEGADWLAALIASRVSFLISGGTGAGKTTVLASLLELVQPRERILIVEDSKELTPNHPHVVSLETRPANVEAKGAVPMRDLVRQALRMRPDRIVTGEVRGAEIVDLLNALNTGHRGGCATLHANSAASVPARIEALAVAAQLPRDAVHAQLAVGIEALVHVTRSPTGHRYIESVSVLALDDRGLVRTVPALFFRGDQVLPGTGLARLEDLLGQAHVS